VDDLPPEALDWSPGEGINSIVALISHVVGSERFWIGDVAMQEPKERDRDAEFRAHGLTAADLHKRIEEAGAYAHAALERLTRDDLALKRPTGRKEGEVFTVGYALAHALKHAGSHAGHIELMRDWWRQQSG
jgi:uncharacterized damage-inducible protein DinB